MLPLVAGVLAFAPSPDVDADEELDEELDDAEDEVEAEDEPVSEPDPPGPPLRLSVR